MCKESRRVQLLILSIIFFRFSFLKPCQRWQRMTPLLRSNIGEFLWKKWFLQFCSLWLYCNDKISSYKFSNKVIKKQFWGLTRIDAKVWELWLQTSPSLFLYPCYIICPGYLSTLTTKAKEILYHTDYSDGCDTPLLRLECSLYLLQQLLANTGGKLHSFLIEWFRCLSQITVESSSSQISAEIQNTPGGWIAML